MSRRELDKILSWVTFLWIVVTILLITGTWFTVHL